METTAKSAYDVLDFILRHNAHRSLQTLADVARVNAGNLGKLLSQNKSLPIEHMRRLAVAAGLRVHLGSSQAPQLSIEDDTVVYLEVKQVKFQELPDLSAMIQTLGKGPLKWRFVVAKAKSGLLLTALAHVRSGDSQRGYVAIHFARPLPGDDDELDLMRTSLAGDTPVVTDETMTASDSKWIRLRSGMQSARELDLIYKVGREPEPTALDWAHVLLVAHELEFGPGDIIQVMRDRHVNFLASLR